MGEKEDKEDEEISIDFSKIKSFFKGKKKEEPAVVIKDTKEETQKPQAAEKPKTEEKKQVKQEIKSDKDEEDEDIGIDFSKIKSFFRKKEEPPQEAAKEKITDAKSSEKKRDEVKSKEIESEDDEEISFNFGKVKDFFKGLGKSDKESSEEKSDDDISFNIKKTTDFFGRHKKIIIPILLILITMSFSVYLRMQMAYLPITDNWARDAVYNSIRSQIGGQIDQQYPNLPDANKNSLVEAQFNKVLSEQKTQIEQQIQATSAYFKSTLQKDNGLTHNPDIDPYFWIRYAQNIVDHGYPGDEIRGGVQWDNHMLAPTGRLADVSFHQYFMAYLHKISMFFGNKDIFKTAFYAPIIISALAVIPAFFITKKVGGNFGGAIAAFVIAIHPALLVRSSGGVADTDAYNFFFPLLITWMFLEAFESTSRKKSVILNIFAGFLVGVYSFTWIGWWYIFDFILLASSLYIIYYIAIHRDELRGGIVKLLKKEEIKNSLIALIVFFISSAFFVTATGASNFIDTAFNAPMGFVKLKEVGITTIWPNVYTTVAEQNPAALHQVISQISFGNNFLFFLGLIGLIFSLFRRKSISFWFLGFSVLWYLALVGIEPQNLILFTFLISIPIIIRLGFAIYNKEIDLEVKESILLFLWLAATIYASTKGIRFTILLVPAFSITFGIAFDYIYRQLSLLVSQGFHINKYLSKVSIMVILFLLLISPFNSAYSAAINEIPMMNDAWYESLDKIRRESAPNAIVNSWWDFGHWFKLLTDRAVTFDGTTQSTPQAHWIGLALLTDNEDLAIGILRMLDCSGYESGSFAFDAVENVTKDTPKSIDIMYKIMELDKESARIVLKQKGFDDKQADQVLENTHCNPPEDYFITSADMIGKSGVWAHFGSWDFERALIYNTLKQKEYEADKNKGIQFLQQRYNYTLEQAQNMVSEVQSVTTSEEANQWIAPWPSYASGVSGCSVEEGIAKCGNGLYINLTNKDAWLPTQQGNLHPKVLVYLNESGLIEKQFNETTIPYGAALIPEGDGYKSVLMASELSASMFTRLFFMDGHGLRHFKLFSYQRSISGEEIFVWKVDWEGSEPNIMDVFKKEPALEINQTKQIINESNVLKNTSGKSTTLASNEST